MAGEPSNSSETRGLSGWLDECPHDVWFVLAAVAGANLGLLVLPSGAVARILLALPLLFILPGYALLAAAFPRRAVGSDRLTWEMPARNAAATGSLAPFERVALSVGLSVALVPPLGLVVATAPVATTVGTLAAVVSAVVVAGMFGSVVRRLGLPEAERYESPMAVALAATRTALAGSVSTRRRALNLCVVVVVVLSLTTMLGALAASPRGASYTSMTLLTQNESGEYVSSGYPETLASAERQPPYVELANHEGQTVDYTLVTTVQRVRADNGSVTALDERETARSRLRLDAGESRVLRPSVRSGTTGTDVRVVYLLYRGDAPADPSVDTAYRYTQFWVNGTQGS